MFFDTQVGSVSAALGEPLFSRLVKVAFTLKMIAESYRIAVFRTRAATVTLCTAIAAAWSLSCF